MAPNVRLVVGSLVLAASVAGPGSPALTRGQDAAIHTMTLAIIVNRANPVTDLSLGELRRIFLYDTQYWPHGRRVTLVQREPGQLERAVALTLICRMAEADYQRYVLQETFRGNATPAVIRTIRTTQGMRAFVYNAPGAIGYLDLVDLDASVKALRINGLAPSSPGYALRWTDTASRRRGASPPEIGTDARRWR